MTRSHPWVLLAAAMPEESANLIVAGFKSHNIVKSYKSQCRVCIAAYHENSTARMRLPVLRGDVATCLALNQFTVEEAYRHNMPVTPPPKPTLTPAMKQLARERGTQGLKHNRIWEGLTERFSLTENTMPELAAVQRVVNCHISTA
ncbi:LOW QUALITY PROTEIN: hypothetical protein PHMEG_00014230 [Phytophthora megakarya]|uniref:Uncharacterized protein n=1 Tax=Phytophthora megakarya TaxID=4795 RepID=A0A225W5V1_9STRA|nr:LOW QUALITY PROTEIN: hypothetical protein PHMEG_00014230 [Phytophthora megakarya]